MGWVRGLGWTCELDLRRTGHPPTYDRASQITATIGQHGAADYYQGMIDNIVPLTTKGGIP